MAYGKKGNAEIAIRAYEYGCLLPLEGREECLREMAGRVALWNRLVDMERDYTADYAVEWAKHLEGPHSTDKDTNKARWNEARKATRGWEREAEPELPLLARSLGHASGLHWLNKEDVKLAWQLAHKAVWHPTREQLAARQAPPALQYHRALEHRKLSLRWQTGLPVAEAFGDNMRLRIAPVDIGALCSPERSTRRQAARTMVMFRIRSDENGKPIWLRLPLVLHRPLPADGLIQTAAVLCRRVGRHERWSLVLSVRTPKKPPVNQEGPQCGVHLCWRRTPDGGVLVATWADSQGGAGQLTLPSTYLVGMARVEECQSERDIAYRLATERLVRWANAVQNCPDWVRDEATRLEKAKGQMKGRLRGIVRQWRERTFDGDEEMRAVLEKWDEQEKRLGEEEANLRERLLLYRREQYRLFAARLAGRYAVVKVTDLDLAKLAQRDKSGKLPKPVQYQRQLAALSTLRLAMKNVCGRTGSVFQLVDGAYSARICAECGYMSIRRMDEQDAVYCDWCHVIANRGVNSAKVLLAKEPVGAAR